MTIDFEEIDFRPTPLGDLVLRRRRDPRIGDTDIYEVKLGEEFLMSSLFHASEVALADLGLAALDSLSPQSSRSAQGFGEVQATLSGANPDSPLDSSLNARGAWDVLVGGLGLGYTARAALANDAVRSLLVVDLLQGVIDWHHQQLVPLGASLTADPRCGFVQGDFFQLAADPDHGFDATQSARRFDAILLDIDHAPGKLISNASSPFYEVAGLKCLSQHLKAQGVFALWSDDPPESDFMARLDQVFAQVQAHPVPFDNPYTGGQSSCTVYIAMKL